MDVTSLVKERSSDKRFLTEFNQLRKACTCPICISHFVEPLSLGCGHTFCKECINAALIAKETCPICSVVVNKRKLVESSATVIELFKMLSDFVSSLEPINYNQVPAIINNSEMQNNKVIKSYITVDKPSNEHVVSSNTVASADVEITVPSEPVIDPMTILKPGVLVNVLPRTWAGMLVLFGVLHDNIVFQVSINWVVLDGLYQHTTTMEALFLMSMT